ncbi:MAG: hypothetical protein U0470_04770 [Anaerolineae bacterium]
MDAELRVRANVRVAERTDLPWWEPVLGRAEAEAVAAVAASGWVN